jgi:hypothetical protein
MLKLLTPRADTSTIDQRGGIMSRYSHENPEEFYTPDRFDDDYEDDTVDGLDNDDRA